MELTPWQDSFMEYFQSNFGVGREYLYPSRQTLDDKPRDCVRWDTKEYPWPVFERFIRELPSGVVVSVVQRVEVTGFTLTYRRGNLPCEEDSQNDGNFETSITTCFLFYKVST